MGRNSGGVTSSGSKGKTAYQKATDALYSAFQVRISWHRERNKAALRAYFKAV